MKHVLTLSAVLALAAVASPPARASDPIGIYALVDRVAFEPSKAAPERIRIWGVFAVAEKRGGEEYQPARRGQLYFRLPEKKRDEALIEWRDLEKSAGSGEPVGLGNRYQQIKMDLQVLKSEEAKVEPTEYPLGFGMTRMRRASKSGAVRGLVTLPRVAAPADGAEVPAGKVTLAVEHTEAQKDSTVSYRFELELATGEKLVSPPLRSAGRRTEWTPSFALSGGEKITWTARAIEGEWRGPEAQATFSTKSAK